MSQKSNTVNFLIHDTNGQPQMVKVVQNSTKESPAQFKINPKAVRVFRVPSTSESSQQASSPVYRTVKVTNIKGGPKVVKVPIQTLQQLQTNLGVTITQGSSQDKITNVRTESTSNVKVVQTPPELVPIPATATTTPVAVATNSKAQPPPIMSHSRKRPDQEPQPEYTTKRRKHADKVGKGLRHFSMKVCEKVRTKGFTSYNEVADELVEEFAAGIHGSADSQQYDQKNIRRRVYDALNVLMAMNIISKEKKEIRWLGLPTNSVQECNTLEKEKESRLEKIQKKTQQLQELILQHISFKSLVERNKAAEAKGVKPSASSAIHLPFIVVNTSDKALIDCRISNDKTEYMFNFNKRFQIYDDIDVLKRMGLLFGLDKGECTEDEIERAKVMVPKSLEYYVEQMGRGEQHKKFEGLGDDASDDDDDDEEEETVAAPGEEREEGSAPEDEQDETEVEEAAECDERADEAEDSDELDV